MMHESRDGVGACKNQQYVGNSLMKILDSLLETLVVRIEFGNREQPEIAVTAHPDIGKAQHQHRRQNQVEKEMSGFGEISEKPRVRHGQAPTGPGGPPAHPREQYEEE